MADDKDQEKQDCWGPFIEVRGVKVPLMVALLLVVGVILGGVGVYVVYPWSPMLKDKVQMTVVALPSPTFFPTYTLFPTHTPYPTYTPCPTSMAISEASDGEEEEIKLRGVVLNEEGVPLKGAKVTLLVTSLYPYPEPTDSEGAFIFKIPASKRGTEAKIIVEAKGYETFEKYIELSDSLEELHIRLSPVLSPTQIAVVATPTAIPSTPALVTATPLPTGVAQIDFAHPLKLKELNVGGVVYRVVFSPDSQWIAASAGNSNGKGKLYVWRIDSWHRQEITLPKPVRALSFGIVGGETVLAVGSDEGSVYMLNVEEKTGVKVQLEPEFVTEGRWPVYSLAFSPDGRWLAFGSWKEIGIWDVSEEKMRKTVNGSYDWPIFDVAFSPDGQIIASAGWDGKVRLWNLEGQVISEIEASDNVAYSVAFKGKYMAVGTFEDVVGLWEVSNPLHPKKVGAFKGHTGDVFSVAFAPNEDVLASGGWDKTLDLWEVSTGKRISSQEFDSSVRSVAFSPDETMLAVSLEKGKVIVWRLSQP